MPERYVVASRRRKRLTTLLLITCFVFSGRIRNSSATEIRQLGASVRFGAIVGKGGYWKSSPGGGYGNEHSEREEEGEGRGETDTRSISKIGHKICKKNQIGLVYDLATRTNRIINTDPNRIPNSFPNRIPDTFPYRIPDTFPNRIPDTFPNRIPDTHFNQLLYKSDDNTLMRNPSSRESDGGKIRRINDEQEFETKYECFLKDRRNCYCADKKKLSAKIYQRYKSDYLKRYIDRYYPQYVTKKSANNFELRDFNQKAFFNRRLIIRRSADERNFAENRRGSSHYGAGKNAEISAEKSAGKLSEWKIIDFINKSARYQNRSFYPWEKRSPQNVRNEVRCVADAEIGTAKNIENNIFRNGKQCANKLYYRSSGRKAETLIRKRKISNDENVVGKLSVRKSTNRQSEVGHLNRPKKLSKKNSSANRQSEVRNSNRSEKLSKNSSTNRPPEVGNLNRSKKLSKKKMDDDMMVNIELRNVAHSPRLSSVTRKRRFAILRKNNPIDNEEEAAETDETTGNELKTSASAENEANIERYNFNGRSNNSNSRSNNNSDGNFLENAEFIIAARNSERNFKKNNNIKAGEREKNSYENETDMGEKNYPNMKNNSIHENEINFYEYIIPLLIDSDRKNQRRKIQRRRNMIAEKINAAQKQPAGGGGGGEDDTIFVDEPERVYETEIETDSEREFSPFSEPNRKVLIASRKRNNDDNENRNTINENRWTIGETNRAVKRWKKDETESAVKRWPIDEEETESAAVKRWPIEETESAVKRWTKVKTKSTVIRWPIEETESAVKRCTKVKTKSAVKRWPLDDETESSAVKRCPLDNEETESSAVKRRPLDNEETNRAVKRRTATTMNGENPDPVDNKKNSSSSSVYYNSYSSRRAAEKRQTAFGERLVKQPKDGKDKSYHPFKTLRYG